MATSALTNQRPFFGALAGKFNAGRHVLHGWKKNRLKSNTTRLSPSPDEAIRDCWPKRRLAVIALSTGVK
jgi:hypothetical protein